MVCSTRRPRERRGPRSTSCRSRPQQPRPSEKPSSDDQVVGDRDSSGRLGRPREARRTSTTLSTAPSFAWNTPPSPWLKRRLELAQLGRVEPSRVRSACARRSPRTPASLTATWMMPSRFSGTSMPVRSRSQSTYDGYRSRAAIANVVAGRRLARSTARAFPPRRATLRRGAPARRANAETALGRGRRRRPAR